MFEKEAQTVGSTRTTSFKFCKNRLGCAFATDSTLISAVFGQKSKTVKPSKSFSIRVIATVEAHYRK